MKNEDKKAKEDVEYNLTKALSLVKEMVIAVTALGNRESVSTAKVKLQDSQHWLACCLDLCGFNLCKDNSMPVKKLAEGCYDSVIIIKEIENNYNAVSVLLEGCSLSLANMGNAGGALLHNSYNALIQGNNKMTEAILCLKELKL